MVFPDTGRFLPTAGGGADGQVAAEPAAVDRFQLVFDQAAVGIELVGPDGRLFDVNKAVCAMLGYEADELIGRSFADFIHPDDLPKVRDLAAQLLDGTIPSYRIEKRYRRKNGTFAWVRVTSSLAGAEGAPAYRISMIEDISERKEAEKAREASETRLRTVLEAIPIGAILGDAEGRIMEANRAYLDLIGRTEQDLLSGCIRWDEITPAEWRQADERAMAQARAGGVSTMYEKEFIRGGERVPVLVACATHDGESFAAFALDLTERKSTEAALQARTAEWEALVETAPVAVWFTHDPDLREVRANRFASELLGLPRVYSQSHHTGPVFPRQYFRLFRNGLEIPPEQFPLRRAIRGEEVRDDECEARFDDGRSVALLYNSSALRDANGSIIGAMSTAVDITERKRSEAALREREARLRSILETAPEALITIGERGIVESFSRSAEVLFGYHADEVVGRNVSMLMPPPYREEHDGYVQHYMRTGEKRIIGIGRVVSGRRKDGSVFPMELAVGEVKIGTKSMFTGFIRDLTATQKIEQELRQAQKMEAVGQLTGGVAHDFNNLLTVILGNLEMLEMRLTDAAQFELVKEARETAEHGAQLTERLLAFGRRQPLKPRMTEVGQLLGEMMPLLRRTLGETITVKGRSDSDLHQVLIDPSGLQNAILNLAINARDAMPSGGRLMITAENATLEQDYARMHPEVRAGRYVMIAVTDTGVGMPQDVQERAFEPFFTTKEVGVGSGLGLSMVYGFVKQSNGHVTIYSEPGHGTTIRIYLPRVAVAEEAAEDRASAAPIDVMRGHGETILLVEDEPRVRRMTVARLHELGYRVLDAANGPTALSLFDAHPEIDLLFTDMVMPGGMTGADVAAAIRERRPGIKVLFTSGYAEPDIVRKQQAIDAGWLNKPYSTMDLARMLRNILGQSPDRQAVQL